MGSTSGCSRQNGIPVAGRNHKPTRKRSKTHNTVSAHRVRCVGAAAGRFFRLGDVKTVKTRLFKSITSRHHFIKFATPWGRPPPPRKVMSRPILLTQHPIMSKRRRVFFTALFSRIGSTVDFSARTFVRGCGEMTFPDFPRGTKLQQKGVVASTEQVVGGTMVCDCSTEEPVAPQEL